MSDEENLEVVDFVQLPREELEYLKFTLETLTEVMKDLTFKAEKHQDAIDELKQEVALLKAPMAANRSIKIPTLG
jgi:hypothetical protein